jgi:DNA-binding SARP family transcriptional activator
MSHHGFPTHPPGPRGSVTEVMESASIFALGAVRCEVDGQESLLHGEQPKIVLTYLCSQHDAPVSSDELADAVWASDTGRYSAGALRGIVSKVRGFLQTNLDDRARVENLGGCYRLTHDDGVVVDVDLADAEVCRAARLLDDGHAPEAAGPARRAVTLLHPPLLPGIDRGWLQIRRAELLRLRRRAMCLAARVETELGAHDVAVELATGAVHIDPYDEASHRSLISAHLAAGDRGGALMAYEHCRRLLLDELGVRPSPTTERLHDSVIGL